MSNDRSRRLSTIPSVSIPSAPPLPAPKPLQRARDAAYKFIGYPSRPSSPHGAARGLGIPSRYASLGATQNATASHKTGLEINTIAINEKGTHALLGGKEIFKTIKIVDGTCVEDLNLRTAIRSTPTQASGKPRSTYSIDIADVAWAKGDYSDFVAAATSSGKIILYDLGHAGLQAAQLHEHDRQVHKVTFNPHKGNLLLSGSQDGTVRLWDVRDMRTHASGLQSRGKYAGQSDGVRDVKWSPTDGVDFAFGTDSGWIQRWDMRNMRAAKVKVPAHTLSCNIIDWHPDGKHIASASSDKSVRVWDFSGNRRQRAQWEIKTPYPVLNARWRPSCESSMPSDNGARQCTQLVTAYDREHPVIHIWDLRRPALPFREMAPYPSAPTDLLWHSQDLLWTVGREGVFLQSDIQHAPKVIDKRNLQSFAVSPEGDVKIVTQKRKQRRSSKLHHPSTQTPHTDNSLSTSPDNTFLSRSWADDSLDHSFLSVQSTKRQSRSHDATTMASSINNAGNWIVPLDLSLNNRGPFAPQQVSIIGKAPYLIDPHVFKYLARKYINTVKLTAKIDEGLLRAVENALNKNAKYADNAGLYRLAQSWRIVGFATLNHLKARAKAQHEQEANKNTQLTRKTTKPSLGALAMKLLAEQNMSPPRSPATIRPLFDMDLTADNLKGLQLDDTDRIDMVSRWSADGPSASPAATVVAGSGSTDADTSGDAAAPAGVAEAPHLVGVGGLLAGDEPSPSAGGGDEPLYSLPDDSPDDLEDGKPFVLVEMLAELIKHHLKTGDAQTATHLVTLLAPLLPATHPLPSDEVEATVLSYSETYAAMGFLPAEAASIVDKHLQHTIMAGLQPLQIESILSFYHDQLMSFRLFEEAAHLRKLAYPAYPAVYEDAMKDNSVHIKCGGCGKPIVSGMAKLKCESCNKKQAPCPICQLNESPYGGGKLMTMCLLCGHGGHAACLQQWFEDADGEECPTGCGCDCVAGRVREEKEKKAEKERKEKGKGKVMRDEMVAPESRAVGRTRTALGGRSI